MEEVSKRCPAIAVPMTVKMPDPMTAPIPSAVSDKGPSVFFRLWAGSSDSRISLSMDFVAKICFDRVLLLKLLSLNPSGSRQGRNVGGPGEG
jgi:hypothetical protein